MYEVLEDLSLGLDMEEGFTKAQEEQRVNVLERASLRTKC